MNRVLIASVLMASLGGFASAAHADAIVIYNTGIASNGHTLATPGDPDWHWRLISSPGSSSVAAAYVAYNLPPWTTNAASEWIAPDGNAAPSQAAGIYEYQTTFKLGDFIPDSASLNGSFAADDCVIGVQLNSWDTGIKNSDAASCGTGSDYSRFVSFSICCSHFLIGDNTLTFFVDNTGGPTGVNISVSGAMQPFSGDGGGGMLEGPGRAPLGLPEPRTLGEWALALLGLGGLWLRRRVMA